MNAATQFTCVTCQVKFLTAEIQRQHYKTDWHRYNLKRKVADFPPVTADDFRKRVIILQNVKAVDERNTSTYCVVCKKSYRNDNSFQNHLNSKKHLEFLALTDTDNNDDISVPSNKTKSSIAKSIESSTEEEGIESESESDSEENQDWELVASENNPIKNNSCLFCAQISECETDNVRHMSVAHAFFIPEVEYVIDLKGLLIYLGEIVCQGMCLWCVNKDKFANMDAAQRHMIDKGHTKMYAEGMALLDYADFYAFDDDSDDEFDCREESVKLKRLRDSIKGDVSDKYSEVECARVLPDGSEIGHRSLMKYYKQKIPQSNSLVLRKDRKVFNVVRQYKALGWVPTPKAVIKKKARDIRYMSYVKSKESTQLSFKANKLQKHFREQVDF